MPIQVTIALNGRTLEKFHIARVSRNAGRNPDALNTYVILNQDEEPRTDREWDSGVTFTHKYADPVEECVRLGIEAYQRSKK